MKFVVTWTIKAEHIKAAAHHFLKTGAALPDSLTMVGRYHAPGSSKGWLIAEGDADALYEHLVEFGEFLSFEVTPVVEDEGAAKHLAAQYG